MELLLAIALLLILLVISLPLYYIGSEVLKQIILLIVKNVKKWLGKKH